MPLKKLEMGPWSNRGTAIKPWKEGKGFTLFGGEEKRENIRNAESSPAMWLGYIKLPNSEITQYNSDNSDNSVYTCVYTQGDILKSLLLVHDILASSESYL